MKIIKRNGCEVPFDCEKIRTAITAANAEVDDKNILSRRVKTSNKGREIRSNTCTTTSIIKLF